MLNPENLSNNIRHDLHDARALLEHAGTEEEKKKYRKAAEIILLKALRQDPENTEAQMLLQSARALPVSSSYLAPQRPAQRAAQPAKQEEPPFIAAGPLFESLQPEKRKKRKPNVLFGLIATVACGGGILWLLQSHRTTTNALAAPVPAAAPMPAPVPVAQPVVEAALRREEGLGTVNPWPAVCRARGYLVDHGR